MFGEQGFVIVVGTDDTADDLQRARVRQAVDAGIERRMTGQGEARCCFRPDIQPRAVSGIQPAGKTRRRRRGIGGIQRAELENDRAGQRHIVTCTAGDARRIENNEGRKRIGGVQRSAGDIAMGDADRPPGRLGAIFQPDGSLPDIRRSKRPAQHGGDIAFFREEPRPRLHGGLRHLAVRQQEQTGTRTAFRNQQIFAGNSAGRCVPAVGSI